MKIKKNINKLIIKKIAEITFVVAFMLFTIPFCHKLRDKVSIAKSYDNITYTSLTVSDDINYDMFPMHNDYALENIKPTILCISNDTYTKENYIVNLIINKNSTLDYNLINIAINNEVYSLNKMNKIENNDSYIFPIINSNIVSTVQKYEFKLWINDRATDEVQGTNLELYFSLEKNTATV